MEAAIDFHPSRGTKNRDADSWVALDPSFKQIDIRTGIDFAQVSGINQQTQAVNFVNSATSNAAEGWISGANVSQLQATQAQASQNLNQYLAANADATRAAYTAAL